MKHRHSCARGAASVKKSKVNLILENKKLFFLRWFYNWKIQQILEENLVSTAQQNISILEGNWMDGVFVLPTVGHDEQQWEEPNCTLSKQQL